MRFLSLALVASVLSACAGVPGLPGAPAAAPAVGTAIADADMAKYEAFFKPYFPNYKVGQKWTFALTASNVKGLPEGATMPALPDMTREVVEVTATAAKLKDNEGKIEEEKIGGFGSAGKSTTVKYLGTESVTVPAGTYADAVKLSMPAQDASMTGDLTFWVAKGVGMVKFSVSGSSGSGDAKVSFDMKAELKEFKAGN